MVESNEGVQVCIGRNSRSAFISMYDPYRESGTVIDMPNVGLQLLTLCALNLQKLLANVHATNTPQTFVGFPVPLSKTKSAAIMVSGIKVLKRDDLPTEPVLIVYAKRGDEIWSNRATFSGKNLANFQALCAKFNY